MQLFINNWSAALTAPCADSDAQLSITPAQAQKLVGFGAGKFYELTLVEVDAAGIEIKWEVVKVTAVTGGVLTLAPRSGHAWPQGSAVHARLTSSALARMLDSIQALQLRVTALESSVGITLTSTLGSIDGFDAWGCSLTGVDAFGSLQPLHASVIPGAAPVAAAYGELIELVCVVLSPGDAYLQVAFTDPSGIGAPFARMVIAGSEYLISSASGTDLVAGTRQFWWDITTNPLAVGSYSVEFF